MSIAPLEDNLRTRTLEMGLDRKVRFCGYIEDHERHVLYRTADVVVFPSLYEPFGIVALEAMTFKVPLVVASTGGFEEIVEHGMDGLKAVPGDPHFLAEQICMLLEQKQLASSLAEKGYLKAIQRYSWDSIARKMADVYEKVADSKENQRG